MSRRAVVAALSLWLWVIPSAACVASSPSPSSSAPRADPVAAPRATRTLTIAIRGEPGSLTAKRGPGLKLENARQVFNADLARLDERGAPSPVLADALPRLNSDTWRVFPDGQMETTYRLRPNLRWHDGEPLTAEDFRTAHRVYTATPIGGFDPAPQSLIEAVEAPDPGTVILRWRQPFPDAGSLDSRFSPLPAHILNDPLRDLDGDAFANLAHWTTRYVGAGPFRLDRWEPGSHLDASAFDSYALGRPKIDRVRLLVVSDPNAAVAGLLAGTTHIAVDFTIGFEHARVLSRQWAPSSGGVVLLTPTDRRFLQVQFRPEVVNPSSILDVRVRRALASSIDRHALNEGLLDGQGVLMDSLVLPSDPWFPAVDAAVTRHAFDPARSEQLMAEAGYARGSDGVFTSSRLGRFSLELRVSAGGQNERQNDIIVDGWKRNGFDATSNPFPVSRLQDGEFRATFPALQASIGGDPNSLISETIPGPSNRWQGPNRGAWSNPEYDRLHAAFVSTLDPAARAQRIAQAMKLMSEELPVIPLYYDLGVVAHVADLSGPHQGGEARNVHEWELK